MRIHYLPIPQSYVEKIRSTMKDDFGNKVEVSIAGETGYGPCRCCLKQFEPHEKRMLFAYAPVDSNNAFNETGPVYIHEDCTAYNDLEKFPAEVKNGRTSIDLLLRSYNNDKKLVGARLVKDKNEVENIIETMLKDPGIAFIHIRNAIFQCFITEARRSQGTGS